MTIHFDNLEQASGAGKPGAERSEDQGFGHFNRNHGKRALDILIVVATAPITVPVMLVLALLVARDGHAPIYRSDRVGKGGRIFGMLKLRTMVPNAEALLERHLAENAEARIEWDEHQKLKNDPRVTRLGRILRKASLDELPQLWNILMGDMSLVGPRPMTPDQQHLYPGHAYYRLRPGLTGPWQVSVRNDSAFCRRAEFDSAYESDVSFRNDLRLVLRTIGVVLRGTGY